MAVGSPEFIEFFQQSISDTRHREIHTENGKWSLREIPTAHSAEFAGKMTRLRGENRLQWDDSGGIPWGYAAPTP